jgi:hypothetical protein
VTLSVIVGYPSSLLWLQQTYLVAKWEKLGEKWQLNFAYQYFLSCRLGGVVISVLATGSKGCGFKTRPWRWIFKGDKNPQHTFLSDGK